MAILVDSIRQCLSARRDRDIHRVLIDVLEEMGKREYPGNVRELGHLLHRALVLADPCEPISLEHLRAPTATSIPA